MVYNNIHVYQIIASFLIKNKLWNLDGNRIRLLDLVVVALGYFTFNVTFRLIYNIRFRLILFYNYIFFIFIFHCSLLLNYKIWCNWPLNCLYFLIFVSKMAKLFMYDIFVKNRHCHCQLINTIVFKHADPIISFCSLILSLLLISNCSFLFI